MQLSLARGNVIIITSLLQSIKISKRPEEMGIELNTQAEVFLLRFASDEDRRTVTSVLRDHISELCESFLFPK